MPARCNMSREEEGLVHSELGGWSFKPQASLSFVSVNQSPIIYCP
jgi:hypothetical protein